MTIKSNTANGRRWVFGFVAAVACLVLVNQRARSDDAKDEPKPGSIITNSIGMKLAYIPAGEFLMGSACSERGHHDDERQHTVRIDRPFRLGLYEVTQGEWAAVMQTMPWEGKDSRDNVSLVEVGNRYPATNVGWEDATEFCRKLTDRERVAGRLQAGESHRLPTEAEWEYACRAGTTTRYHFGNDEASLSKYAWFAESLPVVHKRIRLHEVGKKRANAWGLFDMHGNVAEWCTDWYGEDYYQDSQVLSPQGPLEGLKRVARGGNWRVSPWPCRSAFRAAYNPSHRRDDLGFRVVRTITPNK